MSFLTLGNGDTDEDNFEKVMVFVLGGGHDCGLKVLKL